MLQRLPHSTANRHCHRRAGMALIAVLWTVAIMSLVTMGLVQTVRTEIRVATRDRETVQAVALGDSAIFLALQQFPLLQQEYPDTTSFSLTVDYADRQIPVQIRSISGWLDLNSASAELLALFFEKIGGENASVAAKLADTCVQWREERVSGVQRRDFEAVEDLLQIPGVTYNLYARVKDYVTVSKMSSGGIDVDSAPEDVLRALDIRRDALGQHALVGRGNASVLRITAQPTVDDTDYLVIRDINTRGVIGSEGSPWQTMATFLKVHSAKSESQF